MTVRRFPPPWSFVEVAEAFRIDDANGARLAYVYFDEAERGANSDRWTKRDAQAVAETIANLPEFMRGEVKPPFIRFAAPLRVEDRMARFKVLEATGRLVAAIYCDDAKAGDLTHDEARRIAANFVKLTERRR